MAVTPPGRHDTPVWPFSFRLAPAVTWNFPGVKTQVLIGSQIVLIGILALVAGCLMRRGRGLWLAGAAVLLVAGAQQALPPLAVDAYPTTYRRPSVPYAAASIAHGEALFRDRCASCHGTGGRGDGPAAAGLLQRPADLTAPHTSDHTAGDMYWWLTHGLGLVMPGFGSVLSEDERWDLINFIRALSAGEAARSLTDMDEPERPRLVAPDFAFATGPAQASLKDYRGRQPVLLVLFTLPSSRARLVQLADAFGDLRSFNAAVIAVPMDERGKNPVAHRALSPHPVPRGHGRRPRYRLDLCPVPPYPDASRGAPGSTRPHPHGVPDRPLGLSPGAVDSRRRESGLVGHQGAARGDPGAQSGNDTGGATGRARALMRLWRVVLLLNLAVGVGVLVGWLAWGREVSRLESRLQSQQRVVIIGGEQTWNIKGVVRAVIPEIQVVVLTHDEIPGFMPAGMTMGFKVKDPKSLERVHVGDVVRFTLKGVPPDVQITALATEGQS